MSQRVGPTVAGAAVVVIGVAVALVLWAAGGSPRGATSDTPGSVPSDPATSRSPTPSPVPITDRPIVSDEPSPLTYD